MNDFRYIGDELGLFAQAVHWKEYLRRQIRPYLRGKVLEVGAGVGSTTVVLCDGTPTHWVCLEPDPRLAGQIPQVLAGRHYATALEVQQGTLADLPDDRLFDAILYIDVLEHIEDDAAELARATRHLEPQGVAVVLSPAHNFLYSPFDKSIGHFRRYNRPMLRRLAGPGLRCERLRYLDCTGMLLSLGNRLLARQSLPTAGQIRVWDRLGVPLSRLLDPLTGWRLGKSILAVYRRP
jgi:SAM-dependent methyltransferase